MMLSDTEALTALAPDTETERTLVDRPKLSIELKSPIEVDGTTFDKMDLSEPNVFQMIEASKVISQTPTDTDIRAYQLAMIQRVTGWPAKAIGQLPVSQEKQACAFMAQFENDNRRTVDEVSDQQDELVLTMPDTIEAGNTEWRVMTLHEPVGRQRNLYDRRASRTPTITKIYQAEVALVADVSGWKEAAVLKMPVSLFSQAADYLIGFF